MLLKIAGISRSVYYYYIDKKDIDEKNKDIIEKIKEIYYANKGRYGYRRVTLELKNQGFNINHKKVQRLMKKLNLQSIIRKKRKYSSYRGQVGRIADNHIRRDFEAAAPNQKWCKYVNLFFKKNYTKNVQKSSEEFSKIVLSEYVKVIGFDNKGILYSNDLTGTN